MLRSLSLSLVTVCTAMLAAVPAAAAADFEKYLPKETDIIVSVNIRQALDSPLGKKYAADLAKTVLANNKHTQEALKAFGLDPLVDMTRITVGMPLDNVKNPQPVMVLEGRFDRAKIETAMDDFAKKDPKQYGVEKVSGRTVYRINAGEQAQPVFVAVVDSGVLISAISKELVGAALNAAQAKSQLKPEVVNLLATTDGQSALFVVANTKGKLAAVPGAGAEMSKLIEQIHSLTAQLRIGADVELDVTIGAAGPDEAKKVGEQLTQGIGLAKTLVKLAVSDQPELQPLSEVVDKTTIVLKDRSIIVSGKLTGTAIEKMLKK